MVKYYGRARQRTGSVNSNQLGIKMSGSGHVPGRQGYLSRYISRRVNSCMGQCGPIYQNGQIWTSTFRNNPPHCKAASCASLAAAGGVGRSRHVPYYRIPGPGSKGCM